MMGLVLVCITIPSRDLVHNQLSLAINDIQCLYHDRIFFVHPPIQPSSSVVSRVFVVVAFPSLHIGIPM